MDLRPGLSQYVSRKKKTPTAPDSRQPRTVGDDSEDDSIGNPDESGRLLRPAGEDICTGTPEIRTPPMRRSLG